MGETATKTLNDYNLPMTADEISLLREIFGVNNSAEMITAMKNTIEHLAILSETQTQTAESIKYLYNELEEFREILGSFADSNKNLSLAINDMREANVQIAAAVKDAAQSRNAISNAINEASTMSRKQIYAIAKKKEIDPIFYTSLNDDRKRFWRGTATGEVSAICFSYGRNYGGVYKEIYDGMRKDGYDVTELFKKYAHDHKGATIIDMCSNSDVLRMSFMKNVETIKAQGVKSHGKKKVSYNDANKVPKEISELIKRKANSRRPSGRTYNKLLGILVARMNVNLAEIIEETKNKYGLSSCNVWFAVNHYPELVDALHKIVEE